METVLRNKPKADLDSKARKIVGDATRASFWGALTLDTKRAFVSKSAADVSSAILKSGVTPSEKVAK